MHGRLALACVIFALGAAPVPAATPLPPPRPAKPAKSASIPSPIPLPLPRPPELQAPLKRTQGGFQFMPGSPTAACPAVASQKLMIADEGEIVDASPGCGGPDVMRVLAIRLEDDSLVDLVPAAILRCDTALAIANWVRHEIAPAASALGARLKRIDVAASYHCRPRNNLSGAPLSEHARANAFDVRSFVLDNGRTVSIAAPGNVGPFLAEVRRGACERFTTVLGPGSDKAHELHLHVDLAQRRGGYRMCQWNTPIDLAR
jgi:hypothetical protein